MNVEELELTEHPELLDSYDIWATPALIINDTLSSVGRFNEQEIRKQLAIADQEMGQ